MSAIRNSLIYSGVCVVCYGLSILAGLILLTYVLPPAQPNSLDVDESYYYTQASKLLEGGYTIDTYRPIGFPLVLSAALFLSNSNLFWAKVLLICLSSLRVPLSYRFLTKTIENKNVALISSLIFGLWPSIVYYSSTFYSEGISLCFFLAFLNVLPLSKSRGRIAWIIAGMLFGFTMLCHPMYIFFIPFIFVIFKIERKKVNELLLTIFGIVITILPWSVAASIHKGSIIILSENAADAIAGGLNPVLIQEGAHIVSAPNGRQTWIGPGMWTWQHGYLSPEEEHLPQDQKNELLYTRTFEWIKQHPAEVLYLEFAKVANLWGFYPIFLELPQRMLLGNIPMIIGFFLTVWAFWRWKTDYQRLVRLWVLPIFVTLVSLIACGSWRYRLPADLTIISMSISLIYSLYTKRWAPWKSE